MANRLTPETVIAMAVLQAAQAGADLEIEDISAKFIELEREGFDISGLSLRYVPGGVYSEDVEAFIGRLLAVGYAKQRSPIRIRPAGLELCRKIVARGLEEDPNLARAAKLFDYRQSGE